MSLFPSAPSQGANKGTYGFPLPPNKQTRVAPPRWTNCKLITADTSTEVVPQNVYQMLVMVWGAGANSNDTAGGGGGSFAMGIIDVIPGQLLASIDVGTTAGSTSSYGTLISAPGASGTTGGTGASVANGLRGAFTATGGNSGGTHSGGASGSPYGNGGNGVSGNNGGAAWGRDALASANGTSTWASSLNGGGLIEIANKGTLAGQGATTSVYPGIGCGGVGNATSTYADGGLGAGGGAYTSGTGGSGGLLGGGAGGRASGAAGFGAGGVILAWTEGY